MSRGVVWSRVGAQVIRLADDGDELAGSGP